MIKPRLEIIIEKYVSKILHETFHNAPDELNVYDFDETLCRTEGAIYVINNKTGERKKLSPHNYHEYCLKPDEEFDFSDFDTLINPVTLPHFKRMKADYKRLGPRGVSICTARASATDIIKFMNHHGMPDIEIVAVGILVPYDNINNLNALKKQAYLRSKLQKRKLSILRFFDDNELNIQAANHLKKEFPDVHIETELVKLDG